MTRRGARAAAILIAAAVLMAFQIAPIQGVAVQRFSAWSEPVYLGPLVNSDANEQGPAISRNGLSLFFGSARAGGVGNFDIWMSQRGCVGDPWGPPVNVRALNTTSLDTLPSLSPDEHWLFFTSDRSGGSGDADVWVAYRADWGDDFGWQEPVNLGPFVNSTVFDAAPELIRPRGGVGSLLYFASGALNTALDIYVSQVAADGSLRRPTPVTELNSAASDARVTVRADGLEIFFYSSRLVGDLNRLNDLWTSTRRTLFSPWSAPVNVGAPVNTAFNDVHPGLSRNGQALYFASGRPRPGAEMPPGNTDLWVTTRTELDGRTQSRGCEDEDVWERREAR